MLIIKNVFKWHLYTILQRVLLEISHHIAKLAHNKNSKKNTQLLSKYSKRQEHKIKNIFKHCGLNIRVVKLINQS
jgi:hypothetical protein